MMFLSDIMNAPFALDQDPTDSSFNFEAIKPPVFNSNRKLVHNFTEFKLDSNTNSVISAMPTAKAPTLSVFPIGENMTAIYKFTKEPDATIYIDATKGTISEIDQKNNTFKYIAPDITDGQDTTDTITAYCTKPGRLLSPQVAETFDVYYISLVADGVITNTDFSTFVYDNKNFSY